MLPHLHDAKDKIDKVGEGPIGFSPTFLVWLCFVCFRLIFAFVTYTDIDRHIYG